MEFDPARNALMIRAHCNIYAVEWGYLDGVVLARYKRGWYAT